MKMNLVKLLIVLLASSYTLPALAGQYTVSPVRIYMTPKDRAVAITITNESNEELVMQADLYTWKQRPNGEDELVLTEDLIMSPPIIKLAGKSRQVVRLAKLAPISQPDQRTYRLIVREVPEALPNNKTVQVQIALAFSLPIFITPPQAKYKLDCHAERTATDSIKVICENSGNAYAQLIDFTLTAANDEKLAIRTSGGYILPTIMRAFDIKSDNGKPIPAGKAKLAVRLDDGSNQIFDVMLTK